MKEKVSVIIAAAGKGERSLRAENKIFADVNGVTCIEKTYSAFKNHPLIDEIIITASPCDTERLKTLFPAARIVAGGKTRTESVKNALNALDSGIVLIHDGARPFVTEKIIENCIAGVREKGSAVTAIPERDTVARSTDEKNGKPCYIGKDGLLRVQTPQAFFVKDIKDAYAFAGDGTYNDDGEVYLARFGKLNFTEGDKNNIKLTYPEDFEFNKREVRFGTGFDCHKLVENRKLILGGVVIPHGKGLLGHSDVDVLTHAVMDAMLSAACMRDIGYHFPDSDPQFKDADSMKLLEKVVNMINGKGYRADSISAVIMAEKPKLKDYIPAITDNLAHALRLPPDKVGIGATTLEGLGFVGREEGICVHANAVLSLTAN